VLPATRHKWTRPPINPAGNAGTRFTYPEGMEGWVDLDSWVHTEMAYRQQTVTNPSSTLTWCWLTTLIEDKAKLCACKPFNRLSRIYRDCVCEQITQSPQGTRSDCVTVTWLNWWTSCRNTLSRTIGCLADVNAPASVVDSPTTVSTSYRPPRNRRPNSWFALHTSIWFIWPTEEILQWRI